MAERKTTKPSTSRAPQRVVKNGNGKLDPAQVAQRAYERFLARGAVHGHDLEDWLAAEAELRRT